MIRVRLERRQETPVSVQVVLPILAVVGGAGDLQRAGRAFRAPMCSTPTGSSSSRPSETSDDLLDTLVKASPLLFTGLAVAVAFRAKFWNIGAEGQLMVGACAAAYIGERTWLPGFSLVPLMIIGAALAGGLWALLPALLKVRLKVDDVVTTLLLNSIVLYGVMALLEGPWKDPKSGYPNSPVIRPAAEFPILAGYQLHLGVVLSVVAALVVWWMMKRTTLGFSHPRRRREPERGRLRRPVGRADDPHCGADLRRACRARRSGRDRRRPLPRHLRSELRLRLCRHRHRHARRVEPARRHPGGTVLRRALQWGRDDGAGDRRADLSRRRHPGRGAAHHGRRPALHRLPLASREAGACVRDYGSHHPVVPAQTGPQ